MLLDPDPHSQYGSESKTAEWMRIQVDPDPQHWAQQDLMTQKQGGPLHVDAAQKKIQQSW